MPAGGERDENGRRLVGWVSAELWALLNRMDTLLGQLSEDRSAWSDEAIMANPIWA